MIYKIVDCDLWQSAKKAEMFVGAGIDIADGYIHFSAPDQVVETAAKHFVGIDNLLLVAIDANLLGDQLKWELSRGGALFPHLYEPLPMTAVLWSRPIVDGRLPL